MIATSRPSGRLAVCCDEAFRLDVRIRASWCVLVGMVWRSHGMDRGHRRAFERRVPAFRGGLLACGGQALSLRGARPFQREERRWGVKQQVRSVSHDTARLNPAASSPGSSMTSLSCRTLVRYTEGCRANLADSGKSCLLGSYRDGRKTLLRWRVAVSFIMRACKFPR